MKGRVTADHPPTRCEPPGRDVEQGGAFGVVEVVQQAEQEDHVELAQLAQVVGGENLAVEVAPLAIVAASVSHVWLACIEADVIYLGQPVEVVRRPAAHIEHPVAGLQFRLLEAAVADPVGADALLQGDVETDVAERLMQLGDHVTSLLVVKCIREVMFLAREGEPARGLLAGRFCRS